MQEAKKNIFYVKKRNLLLIAGIAWIIAGVNVSRLGFISYGQVGFTFVRILLSVVVFLPFALMFYKMTDKHMKRIKSYPDTHKPFWMFFDLKSYLIMIFMMTMGIWLRSSGLVSNEFIAVFYTGLGIALTLAGLIFLLRYFTRKV